MLIFVLRTYSESFRKSMKSLTLKLKMVPTAGETGHGYATLHPEFGELEAMLEM